MFLKSQTSIEYLFIMGFVALLTLPLVLIYYTYSSNSSDSIAANEALQIARKIVDASESVYYLGTPSQTTLELNFPDKIQSVSLSNREITFKLSTKSGIADIFQVSSVNMSGSVPTTPGIHRITITADKGFVKIAPT